MDCWLLQKLVPPYSTITMYCSIPFLCGPSMMFLLITNPSSNSGAILHISTHDVSWCIVMYLGVVGIYTNKIMVSYILSILPVNTCYRRIFAKVSDTYWPKGMKFDKPSQVIVISHTQTLHYTGRKEKRAYALTLWMKINQNTWTERNTSTPHTLACSHVAHAIYSKKKNRAMYWSTLCMTLTHIAGKYTLVCS